MHQLSQVHAPCHLLLVWQQHSSLIQASSELPVLVSSRAPCLSALEVHVFFCILAQRLSPWQEGCSILLLFYYQYRNQECSFLYLLQERCTPSGLIPARTSALHSGPL